ASRNARNCASAWWAKRSPTPKEYLASVNMVQARNGHEKARRGTTRKTVRSPERTSVPISELVFFSCLLVLFRGHSSFLLQLGLDRVGQLLRLRLDLRLEPADDLAVAADQELLEVPA